MNIDEAEGEGDRESHYGEDESVVAELFPPGEANPPRKIPMPSYRVQNGAIAEASIRP